ncbi:MAG: hypothetical protein JWR67_2479 [Mucilaginibacter sp.]|nr:hypothetical protein [Mucilaginibacter sp.]
MNLTIKTSKDLKDEIMRLEGLEIHQRLALKAHFSSPSAIFSTIFSMFSTPGTEGIKEASFFKQDFLGLLSRFVLPITLNKTLFKHSNFLIKALVGILSQKASKYISEDSVVGVWDKIKTLFQSQDGNKSAGLIDKVKSLFEGKKPKKVVTVVAEQVYVPVQPDGLKTDL